MYNVCLMSMKKVQPHQLKWLPLACRPALISMQQLNDDFGARVLGFSISKSSWLKVLIDDSMQLAGNQGMSHFLGAFTLSSACYHTTWMSACERGTAFVD